MSYDNGFGMKGTAISLCQFLDVSSPDQFTWHWWGCWPLTLQGHHLDKSQSFSASVSIQYWDFEGKIDFSQLIWSLHRNQYNSIIGGGKLIFLKMYFLYLGLKWLAITNTYNVIVDITFLLDFWCLPISIISCREIGWEKIFWNVVLIHETVHPESLIPWTKVLY